MTAMWYNVKMKMGNCFYLTLYGYCYRGGALYEARFRPAGGCKA